MQRGWNVVEKVVGVLLLPAYPNAYGQSMKEADDGLTVCATD